jgi:DNA-binding XRE family transcriptional regulator
VFSDEEASPRAGRLACAPGVIALGAAAPGGPTRAGANLYVRFCEPTTWLGREVLSRSMRTMDDQSPDPITDARRALGRALRELRRDAGLTQKELGLKSSANDTYISQVESGQRDIRWSTITRLLMALDLTVADLAAAVERQERSPKR